jgi:ubiquinone/menaquinone biosynthesis C-methylase UbiE
MQKITTAEKNVSDYYEKIWSQPYKVKDRDKNPFLGFHYGLYEKGIKDWREAAINMNDFVGRLLKLDSNKSMRILDAGCGIGSTSIYLAMKYPNVKFTGITLAPSEIKFAKNLQKEKKVKNTDFFLGSYINNNFPKDCFDGVYAIESFCYTDKRKEFVKEMKRILKSNGKLIIVDGFQIDEKLGSFMYKVYQSFCSRRAVPGLMLLNDLIKNLENEGFKDIDIIDLLKNKSIVYNFLQFDFIKFIYKFFSLQFIRLFRGKKYRPKEDIDYIISALVPELLLGLGKKAGYYAITAVKE